jgi:calcium-dependent protein kinase
MTTVKVGTAYYVAPEILDGHGYDKSVDIWALGLMFDELLHGTPFYNGNSEEEVFKKIRHDPFIIRNKKYYDHQDDRKTIIQHILIGMIERDPIKRRDLTWIL